MLRLSTEGIGFAQLPPLTRRDGIFLTGYVFVGTATICLIMLAIRDPMPMTISLASAAVATWTFTVFRITKE